MEAVDPLHEISLFISLHSRGFTHYKCERRVAVYVNILEFITILEDANNSTKFSMKLGHDSKCIDITFSRSNEVSLHKNIN